MVEDTQTKDNDGGEREWREKKMRGRDDDDGGRMKNGKMFAARVDLPKLYENV